MFRAIASRNEFFSWGTFENFAIPWEFPRNRPTFASKTFARIRKLYQFLLVGFSAGNHWIFFIENIGRHGLKGDNNSVEKWNSFDVIKWAKGKSINFLHFSSEKLIWTFSWSRWIVKPGFRYLSSSIWRQFSLPIALAHDSILEIDIIFRLSV